MLLVDCVSHLPWIPLATNLLGNTPRKTLDVYSSQQISLPRHMDNGSNVEHISIVKRPEARLQWLQLNEWF